MTGGLRAALVGLLLVGCASGDRRPEGPAPAELRQAIEELRGEVAELRLELQSHRRGAVQPAEVGGVRAELRAVQAALQALVRDVEQRQLEGVEALDRRVTALGGRVAELGQRLERLESAAAPPPVVPAPPPPATSGPEPAAPPGPGRASTIRRVSPAEAGSEARVSVEADGPLSHRAFTMDDPPRLIVDFENAAYGFERAPVAVGGAILNRVRFIQLRATPSPVIRLVMTLTRPVPHWIETQARGLVIHLGTSGPTR